ncbi:MAG TPA: hypothetical protein VF329_08785 [Gammaproteobacteria bacterium]
MAPALACYRCGASLAALSLPLSRLDECPSCRTQLHVCRMCVHYAPRLTRGCDEDDAPEVRDRESANFCDWFAPSPHAFDPKGAAAEAAARAELARLFGEPAGDAASGGSEAPSADDQARRAAESLFKR